MRHRQRGRDAPDGGDRRQRHLRAPGAADAQALKRAGIGHPARIGLQHHAVLVGLGEDGGDLALAETVVQHVLHRLHGHAQPGGSGAVHLDIAAQPDGLLVGGEVPQAGLGLQPLQQRRRPGGELRLVGIHQRVLELGAADAGADLDVLHRLEKHGDAGDAGDRAGQPRGYHGCRVTVVDRFQRDGQPPGIGGGVDGAGADERHHAGDRRIGGDDVRHLRLQTCQLRDRNALRCFGYRRDDASVLLRQKAFGHDNI